MSKSSTDITNSNDTALVWLRNDLRLTDNHALTHAQTHRQQVIVLYIRGLETFPKDSAAMIWREHALADLNAQLNHRLWVSDLPPEQSIGTIDEVQPLAAIYWNREYHPAAVERDTGLKKTLHFMLGQAHIKSFPGDVLVEPWQLLNQQDKPYKVFSAYYRRAETLHTEISAPSTNSPNASASCLPPSPRFQFGAKSITQKPWANRLMSHWQATRESALSCLQRFAGQALANYAHQRDYPGKAGVSMLSPYLAHGLISPREVLSRLGDLQGSTAFARQLAWRDFARYVLFHWPETASKPLDSRFNAMPWEKPDQTLIQWQCGHTGIPLVDAGMRQLWQTGYMHNRIRMVVASYLSKHLLIDWRWGAEWFMHTLVDADLANNTLGWQWTAGCGVDSAPYFRVFNPATQGARFDPNGDYVRRWVPELQPLNAKHIHTPWTAPERPVGYPAPLVDLAYGRERALQTWNTVKEVSNEH